MFILSEWSVDDYLGLLGLISGVLCSLYLLYDWLKYRREQSVTLLWAISLTLFYIFLIPFILVKFGTNITLPEWFTFFANTIPLIFLGWVFIYWGILQMRSSITRGKSFRLKLFLSLWVITSFIFYAFRFSSPEYGKILSVIGIVVFFLTVHALCLSVLWGLFKKEWGRINIQVSTGLILMTLAVILSTARYIIVLGGLAQLPQDLWLLTIASFDIGFILRSVVVILLAVGLTLVHRHYFAEPKA